MFQVFFRLWIPAQAWIQKRKELFQEKVDKQEKQP
jgi:hypothetical protein